MKIEDLGQYVSPATREPHLPATSALTLRDHFASQVITGLLCSGDYSMSTWDHIALTAYDVADAMLRARGVKL